MAIETPEIRVSSAQPIEAVPEKSRPLPTLVIQPTRGWSSLALREIWQYRELLWIFVSRNVKGRYRQMALGPLWIILKPLVDMVVFTVIFGKLAKLSSEGLPYPIFTFAAIVPWTFFANATSNSVSSLINNMHIISKVYFPRMVVPISAVIGGLVDMTVAFVVLMGMMVYYKVALSVAVLALPLYVLLAIATALGVGLWCATIAVKFRDLQYAIDYGLQVLKFATPVAYTATLIPPQWQTLYRLNPMFWVVEGFRWALLGRGQPPQTLMFLSVGIVLLLLISGAFIFRRTERTIVDLL